MSGTPTLRKCAFISILAESFPHPHAQIFPLDSPFAFHYTSPEKGDSTKMSSSVAPAPDFFILDRPYQMVSGAGEAAKFIYRKVVGKRGVWLFPTNSSTPGEQVHFHDPADTGSQGYGGSTLHFLLEDGTTYDAKGPWHSNTDALFSDTGVDIRNTFRTFGVVAKKRTSLLLRPGVSGNSSHYRFDGLLHLDSEPQIGDFDRIKKIALEFATKLEHPVVCYSESNGGSSCGWEVPPGTEWKAWTEWFKKN